MQEYLRMNAQELSKVSVIQSVVMRNLTQVAAAKILGLSERQIRQLKKSRKNPLGTCIICRIILGAIFKSTPISFPSSRTLVPLAGLARIVAVIIRAHQDFILDARLIRVTNSQSSQVALIAGTTLIKNSLIAKRNDFMLAWM